MLFESGGKLYSSSTNGSYVSSNGGTVWTFITTKGFNTLVENDAIVFGGNLDGVLSWNVGSINVKNSGLGGSSITNDIHKFDNKMYVATDNGLYTSADDGNTWLSLNSNLPLNIIVTCISKSGNNLIIGTKENGVFISSDSGNSWTSSNLGLTIGGTNYSEITSIFTYNDRVFLGAKENLLFFNFATLFISDNNGLSWTQSSNGLSQDTHVRSICNYGQYILLGTNSGVYITPDYGANWFFDGLSESITAINSNSNGFYASSSNTIYFTSNLGNTWTSQVFGSGNDPIQTIANINDLIYIVRDNSVHYDYNENWNLLNLGCLSAIKRKGLIANDSGTLFIGSNSGYWDGISYDVVNNGISKYTGSINSNNESLNENLFSVKPNPSDSYLTISVNTEYLNCTYYLTDGFGKILFKDMLFELENTIDVSNLSPGMYYLKISDKVLKVQITR
jgi:photosystem II stability/assembly factor-like uncharacterized protein